MMGETSEAIKLLERTVDEHYPWVIHYNVDTLHDPLRGDPDFRALLRRIGIPELPQKKP